MVDVPDDLAGSDGGVRVAIILPPLHMTGTPVQPSVHVEPEPSPTPADDATPAPDPTSSRPVLTLGELAGVIVAVAVTAVATASLVLAQLGRHDGRLAIALGLAVTAALAAAVAKLAGRPHVVVDKTEIAILAVVGAAALFFFAPGAQYAYADKDFGVYAVHGFAIAREGNVVIPDEVLERDLPVRTVAGRFPGFWIEPKDPDAVTPQFYHLLPATLATADDVAGPRGLFNVTPAISILAVGLLVLAARRAAGTVPAVVLGGLLVTSMMQVWQARIPSTEPLAQFFVAGTLLAAVLALKRQWTPGAFVAGLMLGAGFLARPDGFLYMLLAAGVVAVAIAARRLDRQRAVALALGLAALLPYAVFNAYDLRISYTRSVRTPSLTIVIVGVVLVLVGGVMARFLVRPLGAWLRRFERAEPAALARCRSVGAATNADTTSIAGNDERAIDASGNVVAAGDEHVLTARPDLFGLLRRWQRPLGIAVTIVFGLVLLALWYRQAILGVDTKISRAGEVVRSLDEQNMRWLSFFTTIPGLAVVWLGMAVLLLRRSSAALFALVLPISLLLPVFLWDASIAMRLMWWVRRFIPAALPALLLLMALGLAWAIAHRGWWLRIAGSVAAVALVVVFASQSLPLRDHREMAGSWDMAAAISATAGDRQGVFLYTRSTNIGDPLRNTGGAVWFIFDEIAAKLPRDYDLADLEAYQSAFPDQPVYVVTLGEDLPDRLPPDRLTKANTVVGDIVFWEESTTERPDEAITQTYGLTLWELTA